jgi:hypothetical protein
VLLHCLHLRGPLMCHLLQLRVALTRCSDWYFACFLCFAHSTDRPCKRLKVYARCLQVTSMPVISLLALSKSTSHVRGYNSKRILRLLKILEKCMKTRCPAPVPARNARSLCLTSQNVFWICLDSFANSRSLWTVRSQP